MEAVRRHRRQGSRRDPTIDTEVMAAARRLLVERGYAATTIDLIATTAGVSRPAVYRRWSSKAQLVHEALFPDLGPEPPEDDFVAEIEEFAHPRKRRGFLVIQDLKIEFVLPRDQFIHGVLEAQPFHQPSPPACS